MVLDWLILGMALFQSLLHKQPLSLVQPEDFSQFYEQAHLGVFRYVMALTAGNQAEAEDITAEAFFRAWEKRETFSGGLPQASGWVIAIARNCLIDRRRAEGAHPVETNLDETMTGGSIGIEAALVQYELVQGVLDQIQRLPFPQRDMLTLRYVLGWKVKAIASHLGLPENTVSVDLRRALAKLQTRLAPREIDAGRTV